LKQEAELSQQGRATLCVAKNFALSHSKSRRSIQIIQNYTDK